MSRSLCITLSVLVLSVSTAAHAQDALVEGPGVKVGEATVLHPHVAAEAGVNSNVFYQDSNELLAPILRLIAGMDIASENAKREGESSTAAAPALAFRAGLQLAYQEYLTSNQAARDQRKLDVSAVGDAHFFPKSNASFRLQDKFDRLARPTNFESTGNLTRDVNHFIGTIAFHPRGRTLSVAARYENVIDVFESGQVDFANRIQHIIGLRGNWKFFPYSQAYVDASFGFFGALGNNTVNGSIYKISSNPLRVVAGVDTLITPKTTVNAYIGYANGFYAAGPSFNTPIGGLTLGWRYAPFGRVVLRYAHEVRDSINANYFRDDGVSLLVNHTIRGNVILSGGPGFHFRQYDGIAAQIMPSSPTRSDFILDASLRVSWMIQDRLSLYADYELESVQTDFRQVFNGMADNPSYIQHVAVAGLAAAF